MQRAEFLTAAAALAATKFNLLSRTQDDKDDPADQGQTQALRVLLGAGSAQILDAQTFLYEGRRYRGTFANGEEGRVINTVALEDYLYSVVPREMPPSWPAAALQVQAVVARTFVLQRSNPNRDYDLVPSEVDQVYTGMDSEHPQSSAAVDATAGQALRFENAFALAMYSSCCGGHTESSHEAWGGRPVVYLGGVRCTYCAAAPWYAWSQQIPLARIQADLAPFIADAGDLQGVELDDLDESGRSKFWTFHGQNGSSRIPAAKVRSALGTRVLPSLLVRRATLSTQAPRTLTIEGAGLGHGVGLCQWGARGMALAGADALTVLTYYYPGTGIGND